MKEKYSVPVRAIVLRSLILVGLCWLLQPDRSVAQTAASDSTQAVDRGQAPRVYLDCGDCDFVFVRQEITFVNYVRDPELAQVHVFVTGQVTGSGGVTYQLTYKGLHDFEGVDNTLTYTSPQGETYEERRQGLVEMLKVGLVPYVARTPLGARLTVSYTHEETDEEVQAEDPWNYWVFDINGNGSFNSEESMSFYAFSGNLSADRITEAWKITNDFYANNNHRSFVENDATITSTSYSRGYNGSIVKSLTDHWSTGAYTSLYSNTFRNMLFGVGVNPAVEYNIFPYEESSRKELTLVYQLGFSYRRYHEETLYFKMREVLFNESVHVNVRIRQPWGYVFAGVSGSHYLHDFSKNSVDMWSNVSFRLAKGLSLRFSGNFNIVHDQLYLPRGGASLEDLLLQQRQLATNYELSGSIGLAYTFGSIYNNIVNTRL